MRFSSSAALDPVCAVQYNDVLKSFNYYKLKNYVDYCRKNGFFNVQLEIFYHCLKINDVCDADVCFTVIKQITSIFLASKDESASYTFEDLEGIGNRYCDHKVAC